MNIKLLITLALMFILVIFIIQNVNVIEIRFLFWAIHMSRSLLIFLLLVVGVLMGWFMNGYMRYRKTKNQ
jgi:putative membrane protein